MSCLCQISKMCVLLWKLIMAKIIPGILTDNEADYHKRLLRAEHVADLIQVDLIDGKFAPNTTIGPDIIKKYHSSSMLEVQLMVDFPQSYINELVKLEYVSRIIFPFEVDSDTNQDIYSIKAFGKQAGLSVNPETPISAVLYYMDDIDVLCIFSASPGFAGKKLEEEVYARIKQAKKLSPNLPVEVDIGVNFDTAQKLAEAGADFLVATSVLHNSDDYRVAYEKLAKLAEVSKN